VTKVIIALCLFLITGVNGAVAEDITIAAASDLNFVFRELVTEYEKLTGDRVRLSLGSLYQYAVGRIVLWTGKDSRLDLSKGLEILRQPTIKKIAIANPKHAPYGRAAVAAMEHAQVYDRVKDKLVLGENISQAAQFIESGAADVGIIAMSLALAPLMQAAGQYWEIPADAHPPIEQGAVILKGAKNQERAKAFLSFVQGAEGQAMMKRYGFVIPRSGVD
jgi:molybdate transport system substrate-binding protein